MKATYIDCTHHIDEEGLKKAAQAIRDGKLVVFPTETVYGIGANGLDGQACKKIYEAKGRSQDNPLILHICDQTMLSKLTCHHTNVENTLIQNFFPGPFTLILNRTHLVPNEVTARLDTVAIRMPDNLIAQKLIQYAGVPIAAPSANVSGRPSGTTVADIIEELGDKVDYIIDGGKTHIGLESTVVRVINEVPTILRPGKITKEDLEKTVAKVNVDSHLFSDCNPDETVLSPGMKHRHYAPRTNCILVYHPEPEKLISAISSLIQKTPNCLVISTSENKDCYGDVPVLDIGSRNNLEEISQNIFSTLRKVDAYHVDQVIIEGVAKSGLGLAIMNRLIRACEYRFYDADAIEKGLLE